MEDAICVRLAVFHFLDPIHRSGIGIKIIFKKNADFEASPEVAQPDQDDLAVCSAGGQLEMCGVRFDADAKSAQPDAGNHRGSATEERVENYVVLMC